MPVNIHDERLARLYFLADHRGISNSFELDAGFGMSGWVNSYSQPDNTYYVKIKDGEVYCHCKAGLQDIACTHASVAIAQFYPSIVHEWYGRERREWATKVTKKRQSAVSKLLRARTEAVKREMAVRGEKSLFVEATV